jgi:hypothetical protein
MPAAVSAAPVAPTALPPAAAEAVRAAVARRDARRFCEAILPHVSRTFAIGIRVLPGTLGRAVLTAYLICRIADTVEDAPGMTPDEKGPLFDALLACFDGPAARGRVPGAVPPPSPASRRTALVRTRTSCSRTSSRCRRPRRRSCAAG